MKNIKSSLVYYAGRVPSLVEEIFFAKPSGLKAMDYNAYWRAKGDMLFTGRCPVFAELVTPGSSVLDIGCGEGTTLKFLEEKLGIRGSGLDISPVAVAMAQKKGVAAAQADASAKDFSIPGVYDHIIISEVLEHIPNPEELLAKVKGKFNISLIVSIPNSAYYIHRLRLLFGRFPIQWAWHPGEHLRFWSLTDFRELLADTGFEIISVKTHSGFLFLHGLWPNLFADSAVFEVREAKKCA
ncbi:MAG: methionine biosynthesis protein MetW [Elusimicrobiales bacterium]|nr:methionine biosynthesis protein MetW [Elusimicrobiales bacterium]